MPPELVMLWGLGWIGDASGLGLLSVFKLKSRVRVGSSSGSQFQSYLPRILRVRLHHYQKLATFEKVVLLFLMWANLSVAVATFLSKKES